MVQPYDLTWLATCYYDQILEGISFLRFFYKLLSVNFKRGSEMRQIKPPTTLSIFSRFDSRNLLVLMIVVIITLIVDSEIAIVADFIPTKISSNFGLISFIGIAIVFAVSQYFILSSVKQTNKETRIKALHLRVTHLIVSIAQYVLAGILAFVIIQILTTQQYNIATVYVSYAISYGLWIVTLSILARAFFFWYRWSNKNVMVLMLTLSMIAYVVNGVTWMAASFAMLTQQKPVITSKDVAYFPEFSIASTVSQIQTASQIASGVAYVLTWIGTVMLLRPYIKKIGKIQFWTIMATAMVYYLIQFPLFVLGYLSQSENIDAMTNILIF
jgi:hypothetical protein